jgi:hypothetical protein
MDPMGYSVAASLVSLVGDRYCIIHIIIYIRIQYMIFICFLKKLVTISRGCTLRRRLRSDVAAGIWLGSAVSARGWAESS